MMFTTQQAADRLGLKPGTLEAWRHRGGGPVYVKFNNKAVRYSEESLEAFMKRNERNNTSQNQAEVRR